MFKECFSKVYLWEIYLFHSFEALQLWKTVCYTFQKWDGFGRKKERENSKAACCSSIEECKPNICGFEDHDKLHQKSGKWTYPHRGVNCNPESVCVKETGRQMEVRGSAAGREQIFSPVTHRLWRQKKVEMRSISVMFSVPPQPPVHVPWVDLRHQTDPRLA